MRHLYKKVIPLPLSSWRKIRVTFKSWRWSSMQLHDCNGSSKIKISEMVKRGTPTESSHLPPSKAHNEPHRQKQTCTVPQSVVYKRAKAGTQTCESQEVMGEFQDSFRKWKVQVTWCLCMSASCVIIKHNTYFSCFIACWWHQCFPCITQMSIFGRSWCLCEKRYDDFGSGNASLPTLLCWIFYNKFKVNEVEGNHKNFNFKIQQSYFKICNHLLWVIIVMS